jgi:PAS domain S-box-containing protein
MNNPIRILYVDDNLHDRQLVRDSFRAEAGRFEIIEADSREIFEQHLELVDFDMVLSDFNILGFDGLQVLQMVKDKNPEMPVVIVTGTGSEEIAVQAMKLGADDYVIKTVKHIQNLSPTVINVLDRKKTQLEHKRTLTALRESEERFRLLFVYSMDAVLLTVPNGEILRANPVACRIFGRTEEEIQRIGRTGIIDFTDPRFEAAIKQRTETGQFIGELTGLRNDGTPFPIELSSALFRNKHGVVNSSMIIRDISERKAAEEALKKRIDQLEHFHQITIGRELAMIELKKEVNELLKKSGQPEKYGNI